MIEPQQAIADLLDHAELKKLFAALDGRGEEIRIVGGAVRNALLGAPVADMDVAATATPEAVQARAQAAGIRVLPTGIAHGTLTLLIDGVHFEVTSLREDVETDGRRATVKFGRDFEADALRRDFTINALSVDARGKLHDYVGGLDDLAARRVRFIGEPQQRIEEDFLRILRFFRFSAAYGAGPLDSAGLKACIRARAGLGFLSRERVGAEMLKLLIAAKAPFVVQVMAQAGLLAFLRVAPWPERLRNMAEAMPAANKPDSLLALAALALHHEGDAERLAEALRLSNAQQRRLRLMAQCAAPWRGATTAPEIEALRQASFLFRPQAARDALALVQAEKRRAPDQAAAFAAADNFLRDNLPPQPPFSGGDLLARGVLQGSALGGALKRLQALWIRAGFPQDPQIVAQLIDEASQID